MLCSFTDRFRKLIWIVLFTFTFYSIPNLGMILAQYEFHFRFAEAQAAEEGSVGSEPTQDQSTDTQTSSAQAQTSGSRCRIT